MISQRHLGVSDGEDLYMCIQNRKESIDYLGIINALHDHWEMQRNSYTIRPAFLM
jgi:hypothetical protein